MLKAGQILPPLPIQWQGNRTQTTVLRGQPALLFFPCDDGCEPCRQFFRIITTSEEFDHWSIRPLWVRTPSGADEPADAPPLADEFIDLDGRCRALLTAGGEEPALAFLDSYQEFRSSLAFRGHRLPNRTELEAIARATLLASPG